MVEEIVLTKTTGYTVTESSQDAILLVNVELSISSRMNSSCSILRFLLPFSGRASTHLKGYRKHIRFGGSSHILENWTMKKGSGNVIDLSKYVTLNAAFEKKIYYVRVSVLHSLKNLY